MPVLFHYLEKLYGHYCYGRDGNITSSFSDSTTVSGHFVYRDWISADIVKFEILTSFYQPDKKTENDLTIC